jgi:hypothetical protein
VATSFPLCVDNTGDKTSLIPVTAYWIISDPRVAKDILVRIVEKCGEEYVPHKSVLVFVQFLGDTNDASRDTLPKRFHHERSRIMWGDLC